MQSFLPDSEVFIIGGGPSCSGFDFKLLQDYETIGCNDAAYYAGTKYLVSIDRTYINNREEFIKGYGDCAHLSLNKYEIEHAHIYEKRRTGIFYDTPGVVAGVNSGHAAINIAYHMGYRRINLLGYDFVDLGHWHDGYNWGRQTKQWMRKWAEDIDKMKPFLDIYEIRVINWNLKSGLMAYEKRDINDLPLDLCF